MLCYQAMCHLDKSLNDAGWKSEHICFSLLRLILNVENHVAKDIHTFLFVLIIIAKKKNKYCANKYWGEKDTLSGSLN